MRKYAFYCYGDTQEFLDYYFLNLFFFAIEELSLDMTDCVFYTDTRGSFKEMLKLVGDLEEIQCLVVPSMKHFRDYDELCSLFTENGIYVIDISKEDCCFEY